MTRKTGVIFILPDGVRSGLRSAIQTLPYPHGSKTSISDVKIIVTILFEEEKPGDIARGEKTPLRRVTQNRIFQSTLCRSVGEDGRVHHFTIPENRGNTMDYAGT